MEYRLQSTHNHMVGRTASVISPFYSLLPDSNLYNPIKDFSFVTDLTNFEFLYLLSIYLYLLSMQLEILN